MRAPEYLDKIIQRGLLKLGREVIIEVFGEPSDPRHTFPAYVRKPSGALDPLRLTRGDAERLAAALERKGDQTTRLAARFLRKYVIPEARMASRVVARHTPLGEWDGTKVKYRVKSSTEGILVAVYYGRKRIGGMTAYTKKYPENNDTLCDDDVRALVDQHPHLVTREWQRSDGSVWRQIPTLAVDKASLDDAYHGKGIGKAMYEAIMREWYKKEGPFVFIPYYCTIGSGTSPMAKRVWDSLARRFPSVGHAVAVLKPPKVASADCPTKGLSFAWVSPKGVVHETSGPGHERWAEATIRPSKSMYRRFRKAFGDPYDDEFHWFESPWSDFLLQEGWARVVNLLNVEVRQGTTTPAALASVADLIVGCVLSDRRIEPDMVMRVDGHRPSRLTVADAVKMWGGQKAEDRMFGGLLARTSPSSRVASRSKLYHWAPKEARASIREYGLDHRRAPRQSQSERSLAPMGIYFHLTLADALDMGSEGLGRTHDLYEVTVTPQVALRPDPYQPGDAVFTTHPIPPSAITRTTRLAGDREMSNQHPPLYRWSDGSGGTEDDYGVHLDKMVWDEDYEEYELDDAGSRYFYIEGGEWKPSDPHRVRTSPKAENDWVIDDVMSRWEDKEGPKFTQAAVEERLYDLGFSLSGASNVSESTYFHMRGGEAYWTDKDGDEYEIRVRVARHEPVHPSSFGAFNILIGLGGSDGRYGRQFYLDGLADESDIRKACKAALDWVREKERESASSSRVALAWLKQSKNLPKNVERYVQEGKDQGLDEGEAWAVAWSRYCKWKEPGSPHCKKDGPGDYLQNQGKKQASNMPSKDSDNLTST